jgi:hypothetical protein
MMINRLVCVILLAAITFACSGGSGGGSSPAAPTPTIAQAAGVWTGLVTQTGASGGPECLAMFQLSNGGSDRYTVSITQNGSTLTATASSQTTGQSCTYSGTAGTTSISLNATSCSPQGYQVTCGGALRDVYLVTRSVTGTVSGSSMVGTTGETWNVYVRGATTNAIGAVVASNGFTLSR